MSTRAFHGYAAVSAHALCMLAYWPVIALGDSNDPISAQPLVAFTVTKVADTNDGVCNSDCSLREAIGAANASAGADEIRFNIPGVGPHTILIATSLPSITGPVLIDGYTQAGAVPNNALVGSNALIMIELTSPGTLAGLDINASDVVVRGMSLTSMNFPVRIGNSVPANDVIVVGNFIGLRPDGSIDGNALGIDLVRGVNTVIGSGALVDRNVIASSGESFAISGNVQLRGTANVSATIRGNYIGTDLLGNGIANAQKNGVLALGQTIFAQIGGTSAAEFNHFAGNTAAVAVAGTASGVTVSGNSMVGNDGLGIDLVASGNIGDGVTANDVNDADSGANGLQNFPVPGSLARIAGGIDVEGMLDVGNAVAAPYTIAVYANTNCDASGNGEGERFLGSASVNLASPSNEFFAFSLNTAQPLPVGVTLSAIATDGSGNSSEFSACKALDTPTVFLVTKTADTNDGVCDADCSLREAITAANANIVADRIHFNIAGAGPHTILIATSLPSITGTVSIDGYTEPGSAVNSAAVGSNAVIQIEVTSPGTLQAFGINADNVSIRGLSLTNMNFPVVVGDVSAAANALIVGNLIGLKPNGSVDGNAVGVRVSRGANAVIGTSALADRNVISASGANFGTSGNIDLAGTAAVSARIQGNYIGTNLAGAPSISDQKTGILVRGLSLGVLIGGRQPAEFNHIAGNTAGVAVSGSASAIQISGNTIGPNQALGIDLAATGSNGDGVTANDINDIDVGPNNLQNFPVLSSVSFANGKFRVSGTLDAPVAPSNATYLIGIYETASCDSSGHGEGERFLGQAPVLISGASAATEAFSFDLAVVPSGAAFVATATDSIGNTSEFSSCLSDTHFSNGFE